jgi:hypothetical protein
MNKETKKYERLVKKRNEKIGKKRIEEYEKNN